MRVSVTLLAAGLALAGCGGKERGSRPPTATERQSLVAAQVRHLGMSSMRCVTFEIAVSRIDDHYARVTEHFHPPYVAGCPLSNGQSLYRRQGERWVDVGDASDPFPCGYAGASAKVIRSLFGVCL